MAFVPAWFLENALEYPYDILLIRGIHLALIYWYKMPAYIPRFFFLSLLLFFFLH